MDRNTSPACWTLRRPSSLSARRAWIEISATGWITKLCPVALRKESVDRNTSRDYIRQAQWVALRKESVDRNYVSYHNPGRYARVALRKESVDRNQSGCRSRQDSCWSLSARRAWIEIPARRAWRSIAAVALRKESVDRNRLQAVGVDGAQRRSPQGERG